MFGLIVAAIIFAVGSIVVAYVYIEARQTQINAIRSDLERLARLAAAQINGDRHAQLKSEQQEGEFIHGLLLEALINFHNALPDIDRLYTLTPLKGDDFNIVLDTSQNIRGMEVKRPHQVVMVKLMEFYDGEYSDDDLSSILALNGQEAYATQEPYTDRFGRFMSGFAPVLDSNGNRVAIVGMDLSYDKYISRLNDVRGVAVGGLLLLFAISSLIGLVSTWVQRSLLKAEDVKNRARRRSLQSLEELEYNQKLLKAIAEMNRIILSNPNLDKSISRALRIVGEAAGVDRVYMMEHHIEAETGDVIASEQFDWARTGIESHRNDPLFEQLSYRRLGFSHWYERFKEGKEILGFVHSMSSAESAFLRTFQVRSIFCCPILFNKHCWGYMALEDCRNERSWTEEQRAIIAASARNLGAAIKRKQEEDARRVADERFRAIFEQSPIGMVINDTEGNFAQANQAFLSILGYTGEGIRKRNYRDFIPEDRSVQLEVERARLDSDGSYGPLQSVYLHRDGHRIDVLAQGILIEAKEGERQIVSIIQDITERLRHEEQMRKALEDADAANRAKGEFLATMSHEIRTPMNGVVGMTGLLMETELNSQQRDYVETIQQSGEALLAIINDILDFSKIEAGRMDLQEHAFSLRDCVEATMELLGPKATEKGLRMAYLIDPSLHRSFLGDETRIRQVLFNLVGNAVKFTESGEIGVRIGVLSSDKEGCEIKVEVSDTGIGIAQDKMDRLFQSFSQVDTSSTRRHGGTGLGLVISQKLIQRMGGKIWVDSTIGEGTRFSFIIPLKQTNADLPDQDEIAVPDLKGKHALLLEPYKLSRDFYCQQLKALELEVTAFESAQDCQAWANDGGKADLALLGQSEQAYDVLSVAKELNTIYRDDLSLVLVRHSNAKLTPELEECFSATFLPTYRIGTLAKHLATALNLTQRTFSKHSIPPMNVEAPDTGQRLSILMAEDNKVNQKVTSLLLKKMGYEADIANNGLEVLEALKHKDYHVILMDMHMPEMDGLEATRTVRRELPDDKQPYIIALTASAFQDFKQECHDAGVNAFLTKPLRADALQKHLKDVERTLYGEPMGRSRS